MTREALQHVTSARESLARLHRTSISPGSQAYSALAQEAIAHTGLAIWAVLDEILALLDSSQQPSVPGLPKGYEITTRQTGNGNRKWRYELAGPQFAYASRHRYDTSEAALGAGIGHAKAQEYHRTGLDPLLAAAREAQALNKPVHVNGREAGDDGRTDVYGIANPEVD